MVEGGEEEGIEAVVIVFSTAAGVSSLPPVSGPQSEVTWCERGLIGWRGTSCERVFCWL